LILKVLACCAIPVSTVCLPQTLSFLDAFLHRRLINLCRCADVLVCRNERRSRTDVAMNQLPAVNSNTNEPSDDADRMRNPPVTNPTTFQSPSAPYQPISPADQPTPYYLSLYNRSRDSLMPT